MVSIGLPVFNGLPDVEAAVNSLLGQDYPNLEIIISDNASTDGTWECLARFASDPRITLIRNETNVGAADNFKLVLDHARGEYFKWAAHDDLWSPNCISTLVRELEQHPDASVAMGATESFRYDGETGKPRGSFPEVNDWKPLRATWALWSPIKYNFFVYGVMRTATLKRAATILENISGTDRMLVAQMALVCPLRFVDEVVYFRRIAPGKYKDRSRSLLASAQVELGLYRYMVRSVWRSRVLPFRLKPFVFVMLASQFYHKALREGVIEPVQKGGRRISEYRRIIRRPYKSVRKGLAHGYREAMTRLKRIMKRNRLLRAFVERKD